MLSKEELKKLRDLEKSIQSDRSCLAELRVLATKIPTADYSQEKVDQSHTCHQAPFTQVLERIEALQKKLDHSLFESLELKTSLLTALQRVENVDQRLVLQSRYVEGKLWEDIAKDLELSVSRLHQIHKAGLKKINFQSCSKL